MTYPPAVLATNKSNTTTNATDHPTHHNDMAGAINDAVTHLDGLLFNLMDYGATGDGVTDDSAALKAARDALVAANGGTIFAPPGKYKLSTAGNQFILPQGAIDYHIVLAGAGTYSTEFIIGSNACSPIVTTNSTDNGPGTIYQNFTLRDCTVNVNSLVPSSSQAAVFDLDRGNVSLNNITFENVDTINMGNLRSGAGVWYSCNLTNYNLLFDDTDQYYMTNVQVKNCNFGRSGGGGNYGFLLQALEQSGTVTTSTQWGNLRLNNWFDDVLCEDSTWDSGAAPTSGFASVGFMFGGGGYGKKLRVRNCHAYNSADDGIEINAWEDAIIEDCTTAECMNEGFYYRPYGNHVLPPNTTPQPERGHITIRNFKHTNITRSAQALECKSTASVPLGHITIENITNEYIGATPLSNTGGQSTTSVVSVHGDARTVRIHNARRTINNWVHDFTANSQTKQWGALCNISTWGKCDLEIDGLFDEIGSATFTNAGAFTGDTFTFYGLQLDYNSDLTFSVKNVGYRWGNVTKTGNGGYTIDGVINFQVGGSPNMKQQFGSQTILDGNFLLEAGTSTDLVVSGSLITSGANHGTEKRYTFVGDATQATSTGAVPTTDGCAWMKFLYSRTNGYKGFIILKGIDGSNYLEGNVTDDGTDTKLNIDKIDAGVRTNLATTTLGARYANATDHWVRFKQQGNNLTLDHFTSAPSDTAVSAAGADTLTYTIATTNIPKFGQWAQGKVGFGWVPAVSSSTADDFNLIRMNVMRGTLEGVVIHDLGNWLGQFRDVKWAMDSTKVRIDQLNIRDCDFSAGLMATAQTEWSGLAGATGFGGVVKRENIKYITAPDPAAVTVPATTVAYTNIDGYAEEIHWYGGTLTTPFVELSTDGGTTYGQILGADGPGSAMLEPGDQIKWTYSSVPTARKTPKR